MKRRVFVFDGRVAVNIHVHSCSTKFLDAITRVNLLLLVLLFDPAADALVPVFVIIAAYIS